MKAKAHVIGGIVFTVSAVCLINHYRPEITLNMIEVFSGGFTGSLLPDIDHKKSLFGSILHLPVKHRTLTHSLLFLLLISAICLQFSFSFGLGIFWGILSHDILDMMGRRSAGICLFYPSKKRYGFFRLP